MEWYEEHYQKSIQMIKLLGIKISIVQYDQLAKKYNLLSSESLKYISGYNFEKLLRMILNGQTRHN